MPEADKKRSVLLLQPVGARAGRWRAGFAIGLLSAAFSVAAAKPATDDDRLLEPAASAEHRALRSAVDAAVKSGRLQLALPGGRRLDVAVTREFRDGFLHLRGRGVLHSVNLVLAGRDLYGQIVSGGREFRIQRRHALAGVVEAGARIPPLADDAIPIPAPAAVDRLAPRARMQINGVSTRQSIDVLAYLDPDVTAALGANGARASWLANIDVSNAVLANSLIAGASFRTIGFVDYTPVAGDVIARLLAFQPDPVAAERRNAFGADFASMYTTVAVGAEACGVAYEFDAQENADGSYTPFSNNADFAYSVNGTEEAIGEGIGCGAIVLTHEFGHNLGANHSRSEGGGAPFRYSAGERCGTLDTADVMSSRGFGFPDIWGQRIYSTPLVSVEGQACGIAESVDNARAVNQTFDFAGAYRSPSVVTGTLSLSPLIASVSEADHELLITLARDGDLSAAASVEVAAIGDGRATRIAVEGQDFAETVTRVEFPAGVDRGELRVPLIESTDDRGTRKLVIVPRYPIGLAVGSELIAEIAITDTTPPPTIDVQTQAIAALETAGTATFRLARSNSLLDPVTVDYVIGGGTATAGADYVAASGTVSWAAGDGAPKSVLVALIDDAVFERIPDGETVNLQLSNPQGGAVLGAVASGVLKIGDNEVAQPGLLSFSAPSHTVGETGSTATITVNRSGGADGAVSVSYATGGGSATVASDYTAASGTLNWADLDSVPKTFSVAVADDTAVESAETIGLVISAPTGGATLGAPATATLTITDNDVAPSPSSGGGAVSPLLLLAGWWLRRRRSRAGRPS